MVRLLLLAVILISFIQSRWQEAVAREDNYTTGSLRLIKYTDELKRDLSGDGQIGIINKKLSVPIMLAVVDEKNRPVAGIKVGYTILSQPAGVETPVEITPRNNGSTDEQGVYRATCRLGDKVGEYELLFYILPGAANVAPSYIKIKERAEKAGWINWLLLGLLGGLAIFLFGMQIAAEGMQSYAGIQMRAIMSDITRKPLAGLGMGTVVTFLMQSSSAATTMLVSLVSARLMTLRQALIIIPGAAIGTTLTVQLISFNILKYSLPAIAIGFFLYAVSRSRRTRALGRAVLGFGLIFFGMLVMSETIAPLKALPFFTNAMTALSGNPFWAMVFSALFTALIQSSGATLGIVIALAHQGVIDLIGAIPIIFGANIGTCITAILASLGASREAKRVAWAHLLYKTLGVIIFYPFMKYLGEVAVLLTNLMRVMPGLSDVSVARQVANTDTLYNVVTGLSFLPFVGRFEAFVRRVLPQRPDEVQEVRPKYLELQILETPAIAIGSVMREVSRMGRFVQEQMKAVGEVLFNRNEKETDFIIQRDDKVDQLQSSITRYLANLTQKPLAEEELEKSIGLLYIVKDLENIGDLIVKNLVPLGRKIINNNLRFSAEGEAELKSLYKQVQEDLSRVIVAASTWDNKLALEVLAHKALLKYSSQDLMLKHLSRLREELRETLETSSVHMDIINYLLRLEFHTYRMASVVAGKAKIKPKEELFERAGGKGENKA